MNINTLVCGYGNIGKELVRKANEIGLNVSYIIKSDGVYTIDAGGVLSRVGKYSELDGSFSGVDFSRISVGFIAIPASANGLASRKLAVALTQKRIPLVSCEKSLFAYYPSNLDLIAHTATVGGGSRILPYIKMNMPKGFRVHHNAVIHTVLNATLNFIMSSEKSMEEAVAEAVSLKYAEPSAGGLLTTLNSEMDDTLLKTCIVMYDCFLTEHTVNHNFVLDPNAIKVKHLDETSLAALKAERERYRYIVSFSRKPLGERDVIGGFSFVINGWFVSAGFKRFDNNAYLWSLKYVCGPGNAALIFPEGKYPGIGGPNCTVSPGAGPGPTVRTMIDDLRQLIAEKRIVRY